MDVRIFVDFARNVIIRIIREEINCSRCIYSRINSILMEESLENY